MGNYNLIVDTSNFKPYDISPALQILHDYRDAYYKLDEQLNKIAEEKGQYIPPEGTKYRDTYDRYNQEFSSVVDDFSKGMNMRNAAAVRNLRNRYLEEIAPINRAAEAYNKYQDKLTTLGPDAIIGNSRTFDDFFGGKNPAIEYRSAKEIQRTAAGVMQGLDNALMKAPEQAGDIAQQYFILRQRGLDSAQALSDILRGNSMDQQTAAGASELVQALDKVYSTFSSDSFSDDAKSKIWENTMLGAIQGIQAPKYSIQHNLEQEIESQKASREYTKQQTEYYRTSKELDEVKKRMDIGYIPQIDGQGNFIRDESGNIQYTYNLEEAAKRKAALNSSKRTTTSSNNKIPNGYTIFQGSDGKQYAVKPAPRSRSGRIDSIIYTQDEDGNWVQIPADQTDIRSKVQGEAANYLNQTRGGAPQSGHQSGTQGGSPSGSPYDKQGQNNKAS